MPEYRIYQLNLIGEVSSPASIVLCADDGAALAAARQMSTAHGVEVWQGDRRVTVLDRTGRSRSAA